MSLDFVAQEKTLSLKICRLDRVEDSEILAELKRSLWTEVDQIVGDFLRATTTPHPRNVVSLSSKIFSLENRLHRALTLAEERLNRPVSIRSFRPARTTGKRSFVKRGGPISRRDLDLRAKDRAVSGRRRVSRSQGTAETEIEDHEFADALEAARWANVPEFDETEYMSDLCDDWIGEDMWKRMVGHLEATLYPGR